MQFTTVSAYSFQRPPINLFILILFLFFVSCCFSQHFPAYNLLTKQMIVILINIFIYSLLNVAVPPGKARLSAACLHLSAHFDLSSAAVRSSDCILIKLSHLYRNVFTAVCYHQRTSTTIKRSKYKTNISSDS